MSESIYSTYWYRVANIKPVFCDSTVISRHVYRGRLWYVLRNKLNGHNHRFNARSYALIGQMDGSKTMQEIWESAEKRDGDALPTQDEVIRLLGHLHQANLIRNEILPSTVEILRQGQQESQRLWKQNIFNPFSMRVPICDPEHFLAKWSFLTSPFFTRWAFMLWLILVMAALVLAALNWSEITNCLADQYIYAGNLFLLWLTYPAVKAFHELGHAFAVKKWGGEVHELGIMLIAFTPIPYVDATASAAFPEKSRRITVAAIGMIVELLLASIALFVWLNVETGIVSALAYNVMLIGGVSTILFNGNPFLRYDGYYILSDIIEIPNLGQRSSRYLGYLLKKHFFGLDSAESPVHSSCEKGWFLFYGPVSFCYRILVLVGLIWLVSGRFFFLGIAIGIWGVFSLFILPVVRCLCHLADIPALRARGLELCLLGGGIAFSLFLIVFALPVPLWTTTQGVVWVPEKSVLRAGTNCDVVAVAVSNRHKVSKGDLIIGGADPFLDAEMDITKAKLIELYASYDALPLDDRVGRTMMMEEISVLKADLEHTRKKIKKLFVRSPAKGICILNDPGNLPGRYVRQGEKLGYVVSDERPIVRTVVPQEDIGLFRHRLDRVEVRLVNRPETTLAGTIDRIFPSATLELPSVALGSAGGGEIPIDPTDPKGLRALQSHFEVDICLPGEMEDYFIGGRAYVRFEHGSMPLARQWWRSFRQLFMRRFYV